jgi:ADP-ribosylglycohydrolase
MTLPANYEERVYAGVLGKIIGVYLGRPFEGWTYDKIMAELGEVNYYVHEKRGVPLIVTDDDISGTFTFLRALPDYEHRMDLSARQIGQTWLNYLIEERTILWWGGLGNSTEHTAYLRLKAGYPAPQSGSIALNSQVVAEQIGAQIFIDGWGMVCPGDPALAAEFAKKAGSVSHDGEALYGAQVVAALEAQAFVESDLEKLLDTAVSFIPRESIIYRLIADLRALRKTEPDWRKAREFVEAKYGYDKYGGNCHMVPNHALIILALLWGDDDFQKTMMIVNTCGWDTDCNSGNVGCIMGVKVGLAGLETGPDWRGPVADRMFLPTAEGGSAITDALTEAVKIINVARAMRGMDAYCPKDCARFHFSLPGAVQSFREEDSIDSRGLLSIENVQVDAASGRSGETPLRVLALRYQGVSTGREARAATPTFTPPAYLKGNVGYALIASPTLYPGQTVRARVIAAPESDRPVQVGLYLRRYGADEQLVTLRAEPVQMAPGQECVLSWTIPDLGGQPVAEIGIAIASQPRANGTLYLDWLTWDGAPKVRLGRTAEGGQAWRSAWINAVNVFEPNSWIPEAYRLMQNHGTGLLIQGTRQWTDYTVSTEITPHIVTSTGLAARVQGLERYYALRITADRKAQLVKRLDGQTVLAEADFPFEWDQSIRFELSVKGSQIKASLDGKLLFTVQDADRPLLDGAVALVVEEGRMAAEEVVIG